MSEGHLLLHLSYLNQWRQGKGHIKDGGFHVALLRQTNESESDAGIQHQTDFSISFSTSTISISGGRVKVISKMDVFMLLS